MKKQKILVVSDTHKMHVNFDLVLEKEKPFDVLFHAQEMLKDESGKLSTEAAVRPTWWQVTTIFSANFRLRWKLRWGRIRSL